ncbi:MAG TPA: hypothetical protein VF711_02880, partial [Acidimicrobiales bacterium]
MRTAAGGRLLALAVTGVALLAACSDSGHSTDAATSVPPKAGSTPPTIGAGQSTWEGTDYAFDYPTAWKADLPKHAEKGVRVTGPPTSSGIAPFMVVVRDPNADTMEVMLNRFRDRSSHEIPGWRVVSEQGATVPGATDAHLT